MATSPELEASILRCYHAEKWRVGTISRQLNIHHSVVKRVLSKSGVPKEHFMRRESLVTQYLPFIQETLAKYPTLAASRLHEMVRQRGYTGSVDHFRHVISLHRPRPHAQAYLRLRTLPGEQGQVDWGHFGHIIIGRARRPLMAFVMVLSYSRKIFLRFYLDCRMANFLRGHEAAFSAWNGLPRVLLYDNLKSAVLERQGSAIRFNTTLLEFAAHYRFESRPVAVARGNEKGRVERAIRYIRDNFFAAREWADIDDLNKQATDWCNGVASNRPCPEDNTLSVHDVFLNEQPTLMSLPDNPYPTHEREEVNVGKTPYVRFDLNDYSIPHTHVRRTLTVCATPDTVSILDGTEILASHKRSYDKSQQIENEAHIKELILRKKQAREHHGKHRLTYAVPMSATLLIKAAKRNYPLKSVISQLIELLDDYGAAELEVAITEALARDVPHPNAVRLSLDKNRAKRQQLPPISIDLPNDSRVRELVVRPHNLIDYDDLQSPTEIQENE